MSNIKQTNLEKTNNMETETYILFKVYFIHNYYQWNL